jgi:squalene-hopene/tetraprenyl-beta-curcumene cyclase
MKHIPQEFTMKDVTCLMAAVLCTAAIAATGATNEVTIPVTADESTGIGISMTHEINAAINRAFDWLSTQQKENGAWSNDQFPALTALPAWSFIRSTHPKRTETVPKAINFLKSCVQPDGGIYIPVAGRKGGGLSNYNTAICMTTLHAANDPALTRTVLDARAFVAKGQHTGDDEYRGGFGYDKSTDRAYADLMNTLYATEALRLTQDIEDQRPADEARPAVDWKAAATFISSMQNTPAAGEADAGGFYYKPGESKAGTTTNANGSVVFRSYGSITYAGMLSLVYAGVDRDDPRVRSAFDWAARHWSLDENPGMGMDGVFFFFNVLTRSLSAYGADHIPRPDQPPVNWRKEVAARLLQNQTIDPATGSGFWRNETGRYWENDPVLVTAYCIIALQHIVGE